VRGRWFLLEGGEALLQVARIAFDGPRELAEVLEEGVAKALEGEPGMPQRSEPTASAIGGDESALPQARSACERLRVGVCTLTGSVP
jgi:hypothetical protein